MTADRLTRLILKPVAFLLSLAPAVYLTWALFTGHLSANPLQDVTNGTGDWTIRFICITLAVTPLRRLTGWAGAIKFRRMLGLFAFFYGTLHFLTYVVLDRLASLDFPNGIVSWTTVAGLTKAVGVDLGKRPFITIGFTAFVLMAPLAFTSTAASIRRLGGRRWQALHRLIYVSAIAAVVHYWWLVKADIRKPLMYAAIVGVLLGFRVAWATRRVRSRKLEVRSPAIERQ